MLRAQARGGRRGNQTSRGRGREGGGRGRGCVLPLTREARSLIRCLLASKERQQTAPHLSCRRAGGPTQPAAAAAAAGRQPPAAAAAPFDLAAAAAAAAAAPSLSNDDGAASAVDGWGPPQRPQVVASTFALLRGRESGTLGLPRLQPLRRPCAQAFEEEVVVNFARRAALDGARAHALTAESTRVPGGVCRVADRGCCYRDNVSVLRKSPYPPSSRPYNPLIQGRGFTETALRAMASRTLLSATRLRPSFPVRFLRHPLVLLPCPLSCLQSCASRQISKFPSSDRPVDHCSLASSPLLQSLEEAHSRLSRLETRSTQQSRMSARTLWREIVSALSFVRHAIFSMQPPVMMTGAAVDMSALFSATARHRLRAFSLNENHLQDGVPATGLCTSLKVARTGPGTGVLCATWRQHALLGSGGDVNQLSVVPLSQE